MEGGSSLLRGFAARAQVVANWTGAVFALLELLPSHPSLPDLVGNPVGRKVRPGHQIRTLPLVCMVSEANETVPTLPT